MKIRRKIYIYIVIAIALVFGIRYWITSRDINVVSGQALMEKDTSWDVVIANRVNNKSINMMVDSNMVKTNSGDIYMDERRNMLISYKTLTPIFSCASNRFFNSMLVLEKAGNRLIFTAGSNIASVNGTDVETTANSTIIDDKIYVPLATVCDVFNYDYEWDYDTNQIKLYNTKPDEKIVPYKYDYREDGKIPNIKNQENYETCWAFATLTALSSTLMPESKYDFSVDHLINNCGYNVNTEEGGNFTMAMGYIAGWKGPVYEKDDEYGDGDSPEGLTPVVHVQEMQIVESKNFNAIKRAVFLYGGVESALYISPNDMAGRGSQYFNSKNNAYCYIGTEKVNHDIVIIGWDDTYPAENFATNPGNDGAFICMNSWGENFGDKGCFYVSYYDSNIGIHNLVYTGIESVDNYDHMYQSDELGWVGQIGYGRESAYFANVFTPEKDEILKAVGFYATGEDTEYEIYCIENFEDTDSFNHKKLVTRGSFVNKGYYTVKFDETIKMKADEKMAVVVFIRTPNSIHPIAIEHESNIAINVDISDGEGYISSSGKKWERVEDTQNSNVCLKFFTDDME